MTESALKNRLTDAMKNAMRAKAKERLGVIRLVLSELKRVEVDERIELDDARIVTIMQKMLKQRRDSINQFQQAGRNDLVDIEEFEVSIIQEFLPELMSSDDVLLIIQSTMADLAIASAKDMGKLMGALKSKLAGKADMSEVSRLVKSSLSETSS